MVSTQGKLKKSHDLGYKSFLKDKRTFLEFLEEFVGADWTIGLDENEWELIDKEFIDERLKKRESDLIYKGKLKGEEVIVYVLMELQSSVDYTMPIRLLFYMAAIWKEVFYNTKDIIRELKGFKLPPIIPIVIYNGEDKWTVARTFKEKIIKSEIFEEFVCDFQYLLFDINRTDDIMLLNNSSFISRVFYIDKDKYGKELGARLQEVAQKLESRFTDDQLDLLAIWLRVMIENNKQLKTDVTIKEALENFEGLEVKTMVSNLGKNIAKSFEIMKNEGREEERETMVKNLLDMGMDNEFIKKVTGLNDEKINQLRKQ